jgi:hypothetical protein
MREIGSNLGGVDSTGRTLQAGAVASPPPLGGVEREAQLLRQVPQLFA